MHKKDKNSPRRKKWKNSNSNNSSNNGDSNHSGGALTSSSSAANSQSISGVATAGTWHDLTIIYFSFSLIALLMPTNLCCYFFFVQVYLLKAFCQLGTLLSQVELDVWIRWR
jgi:hypothetical protein